MSHRSAGAAAAHKRKADDAGKQHGEGYLDAAKIGSHED
jgi:hypothetical protein